MIENTEKPWSAAYGIIGDLSRAAALVLAVLAIFLWSPAQVAGFLIVFAVLLVPRLTHMPRPFDAAFAVTFVLAALVGALGWYESVPWTDIPVHFVTNGAFAAMLYLILSRYEVVHALRDRQPDHHRARIVVLTAGLGLSSGVLWEFFEWTAKQLSPTGVHVGYDDTIGDLAVGGLGSVIAGFFLLAWAHDGGDTHRDGAGTEAEQPARK